MRGFSTILLLFVLSSALLLALQAVPICLLNDPDVVDSNNDVPADSEPQTLRLGALQFNHTIVFINDSESLAVWTAALNQCPVLILPEFETGLLLPAAFAGRGPIIAKIQDWTAKGGLTVSGGSADNVDFLNEVFGLDYGLGADLFEGDIPLNRTAAGAALAPFSYATSPAALIDWDSTLTLAGVPAGQCMYQGDTIDTCAVTFTRYDGNGNFTGNVTAPANGGAVMYLGWDWWNAAPAGPSDAVDGAWIPLLFRQVVSEDCDGNGIIDSLQADCDANGVADACDIAANAALDCNNNDILDSCEIADDATLDCNTNGKLDTCDLAAGAVDCDENGKIDTCQQQPVTCIAPTETSESSAASTGTESESSIATDNGSTNGDGDGDGDGERSSAAQLRVFFF